LVVVVLVDLVTKDTVVVAVEVW
jgi:hypothetical protein